jgi:hypothetical protein
MDTIDANRWRTPKLGTLEPNGGPKMGNHMELNGGSSSKPCAAFIWLVLMAMDGWMDSWIDG